LGNFLEIVKNANKFSKLDINGRKKSKTNFLLFKYIPILISFALVFISRDNFDFETKTIGALLSLFTGILFGQLLKISDKVREIPKKIDSLSTEKNNKRIQEINYLKLFFYFLSYSILISLGIICLLLIESFLPVLSESKLSNYIFTNELNVENIFTSLKVSFIWFYRIFIVLLIIRFTQYILLSVSYIYEYIKFDFSKKENE
jgi:hypothetical protein